MRSYGLHVDSFTLDTVNIPRVPIYPKQVGKKYFLVIYIFYRLEMLWWEGEYEFVRDSQQFLLILLIGMLKI